MKNYLMENVKNIFLYILYVVVISYHTMNNINFVISMYTDRRLRNGVTTYEHFYGRWKKHKSTRDFDLLQQNIISPFRMYCVHICKYMFIYISIYTNIYRCIKIINIFFIIYLLVGVRDEGEESEREEELKPALAVDIILFWYFSLKYCYTSWTGYQLLNRHVIEVLLNFFLYFMCLKDFNEILLTLLS